MINYDDPNRSEVEKIIFPDEASINKRFIRMDEVLALVVSGTLEPELLDINKAYLTESMAFDAIKNDGRDLTAYVTASS